MPHSFDCLDFYDTDFPHYYLCYRLERSIDCQVSGWSDWEQCSAGCGAGTQSRTRVITQQPANDGQACPNLVDKQECIVRECDEVLGFAQRMIRYLAALVVFAEALALVVLLAPLPGGYRQKFIDATIKRKSGAAHPPSALSIVSLCFIGPVHPSTTHSWMCACKSVGNCASAAYRRDGGGWSVGAGAGALPVCGHRSVLPMPAPVLRRSG